MKRIAVVMAVAGVWLTGCASMEGGGGITTSDPCNAGACKVSVDVTSCVITPVPDPLPVKGENNIFWELNFGSLFSYRFVDDQSVALKTASSEFDSPELQANGKKFKLHDKNSLAGENKYPYWIKVQRLTFQGWTDCPPLDPVIVNGH
jgi:hypothetical protein